MLHSNLQSEGAVPVNCVRTFYTKRTSKGCSRTNMPKMNRRLKLPFVEALSLPTRTTLWNRQELAITRLKLRTLPSLITLKEKEKSLQYYDCIYYTVFEICNYTSHMVSFENYKLISHIPLEEGMAL